MKYLVELKWFQCTEVEVEAENEEEAEEAAIATVYDEPWRLDESDPIGDYEITYVDVIEEEEQC